MECNKEEAERCKALSEAHFKRQDLVGAKKYALKARHLFPELEGLPQLFSILDVHIAAHQKLRSGESNCYAILQVDFRADENTIRKQYRKLALVLHPDKNKAFGAEAAFKHISEAWSVLSDRDKRLGFDKRLEYMAARATAAFQNPATLHNPRVPVTRVKISKSRNMNWAPQSQAHVHPQQGAHAHRQQGHAQAHVSQQQGHGQAHAHYQQGQGDQHAYQGQGQAQARVPRQQGQGQGQGQGHVHQGQGQGQAHVHQQQGQGHQQQGQGQVHAQYQQGQSPAHAHQPQGEDSQGQVHQAPAAQNHHAHEQQLQGLAHAHQQQGQGLAHQQQGQGQAHVHQQQGQDHQQQHQQQGQGQVHAQHQQGQSPAHAHRPQGQDSMQAQSRVHQATAAHKHHAHEQQLQGLAHAHRQQGQGLAHAHQQQGQDPTQAQGEVHQAPAQGEAHQAPAPQNHYAEHNQAHVSKPSQPAFQQSKSTFWTACPFCRMQLEYQRAHMNKNLCCPMCYKAFISKEIVPVQGSVLWPPPILQSRPPISQSKPDLKTDAGIKSGLFDTNSDWIPSADSTLPSRMHSNKKTKIGTEDNLCRQDDQKLPGPPAQPSQKRVELQQKGLGRLKKDELRKRVAVQAKEGIERLIARSKGVIAQKLSEEKERKAAADKVSAAGQNQKADIERSALASEPFVQNKPVPAEKEGYVHNTEEKANDADACNSRVSTRKSARPRKEARVSQEGSRFVKSKHAGTGISKVEALQRKRKLASPMDKSLEDQNEGVSKFIKDFENYRGSKNSKVSNDSSFQVDDAVKAADECKMEVPDPDFHNFDGDRTEYHFATGQIWASYDDDDGMPRYYTSVNKVLSLQPLKMQMNWLEAHNPSEETRAWLDSGFQHSCGDFQLGSTYIAEEVSTFSHLMSVDKGLKGGYKIYPRQGDVWAVYKDWEFLKVKEDKRGYDMVEIVAAFDEERGLQVTPLFKVAGFKTIFESKPGEDNVKCIPPQELRRFSHQVPAHRIVAGEVPRILVDCLELDPASTPMNLIYGK